MLLCSYIKQEHYSASCLEDDGYDFILNNECCSIFLKGIFYGSYPVMNGLYVLDLGETEINNINPKRVCKNDSKPAYWWHSHFGHIGKKRLERLHNDGLLDPFDYESIGTCKSCLIGNMTKGPFVG